MKDKVMGVILAGGHSRRFGTDKAFVVPQDGDPRPIWRRMVNRLLACGLPIAVVTNAELAFDGTDFRLLRDIMPNQGPLGGIATAMERCEASAYLVLTCDMPLVSEKILLELLCAHHSDQSCTVYAAADGEIFPFPGIYAHHSKFPLQERLSCDQLSVKDFICALPNPVLIPSIVGCPDFFNMNTLRDLEDLTKNINNKRGRYGYGIDQSVDG